MAPENQKGEVNIQTHSTGNPAWVPGYPYTGESKLKYFLNSVPGYLIAFVVTTALIVAAVYLP
jgi:hypothetical protein